MWAARFLKLGRSVRYAKLRDLDDYLAANTHSNTAQAMAIAEHLSAARAQKNAGTGLDSRPAH